MPQFVALIWNVQDGRAAQTARELHRKIRESSVEWQQTLEGHGLIVLHKDPLPNNWTPHRLQDETGVVFGKLFRQRPSTEMYPVVDTLTFADSRDIVLSKTRILIQNFWGRYIAIVQDRDHSTYVLRDPQGGAVPCMQTALAGVQVIFSNMEECLPKGMFQFTIDEEQIAAHLCSAALAAHSSALKGITFVTPGECITISRDGKIARELYWKPAEIAMSNIIEDSDEAVKQVREVTKRCVSSWVAGFRRIMHSFSGGLDSTIVLNLMKSAPNRPSIVCVNNYDESVYGDERPFARLAAQQAGCPLVEIKFNTSAINFDYLRNLPRTALPFAYQGDVGDSAAWREVAIKYDSEVATGGAGGDQLFYNLSQEMVAFDVRHRFGLGWKFIAAAGAAARVTGDSAWRLLAAGVRLRSWNVLQDVDKYQILMNQDVLAEVRRNKRLIHPWLKDAEDLPPGKQNQILHLTFTFESHFPKPDPRPRIHMAPMLSQPLVEWCLKKPTYELSPFGASRVIQRKAFLDDIPREIAERTTKGIVSGSLDQTVERHRPILRELVMDGWLSQKGFLDQRKLAALLSDESRLFAEGASQLVEILGIEAWARAACR